MNGKILFNPFDVIEDDSISLDRLSPELRLIFKKLNKQDRQTKLKGLDDLLKWIEDCSDEDTFLSIRPQLINVYSAFSVEGERQIRESIQNVLLTIVKKNKKWLSSMAKDILYFWIGALEDASNNVSGITRCSFDLSFGRTRYADVCKASAVRIIPKAITVIMTRHSMKDLIEDINIIQEITHSFNVLHFIIRYSLVETLESIRNIDQFDKIPHQVSFLLGASKNSYLHSIMYRFLAGLLESFKEFNIDSSIELKALQHLSTASSADAMLFLAAGIRNGIIKVEVILDCLRGNVLMEIPRDSLEMLNSFYESIQDFEYKKEFVSILFEKIQTYNAFDSSRLFSLWKLLLSCSDPKDTQLSADIIHYFLNTCPSLLEYENTRLLTLIFEEKYSDQYGKAFVEVLEMGNTKGGILFCTPSTLPIEEHQIHFESLIRKLSTGEVEKILRFFTTGHLFASVTAMLMKEFALRFISADKGIYNLIQMLENFTLAFPQKDDNLIQSILSTEAVNEDVKLEFLEELLTSSNNNFSDIVLPAEVRKAILKNYEKGPRVFIRALEQETNMKIAFGTELEENLVPIAPLIDLAVDESQGSSSPLINLAVLLAAINSRNIEADKIPNIIDLITKTCVSVSSCKYICETILNSENSFIALKEINVQKSVFIEITNVHCGKSLGLCSFPSLIEKVADINELAAFDIKGHENILLILSLILQNIESQTELSSDETVSLLSFFILLSEERNYASAQLPLELENSLDTLISKLSSRSSEALKSRLQGDSPLSLLLESDTRKLALSNDSNLIEKLALLNSFFDSVESVLRNNVNIKVTLRGVIVFWDQNGQIKEILSGERTRMLEYLELISKRPCLTTFEIGKLLVSILLRLDLNYKFSNGDEICCRLFNSDIVPVKIFYRTLLMRQLDSVLEVARLTAESGIEEMEQFLIPWKSLKDQLEANNANKINYLLSLDILLCLIEGAKDDGTLFDRYVQLLDRDFINIVLRELVEYYLGWFEEEGEGGGCDLSQIEFSIIRYEEDLDIDPIVLSANVFFRLFKCLPALGRNWVNKLGSHEQRLFIRKFSNDLTPLLIDRELKRIRQFKDENMTLKMVKTSASCEVIVRYHFEEFSASFTLKIPSEYPLKVVNVESGERLGISESKWRFWLLAVQNLLNQNIPIIEAIRQWKSNAEKMLAGIEPCSICYCVLQPGDRSLPAPSCKTCKNKFHSACLYKWFKSHGQASCPMCRSLF